MNHERIYSLFITIEDAVDAINYLIKHGYDTGHISVISNDEEGRFSHFVKTSNEVHINGDDALSFGAVAGALIGLVIMTVPELGLVMAAGPIVSALTGVTAGAITGAATGSLLGSLIDLGVNEDDARRYQHVLSDGGALVITDTFTGNWNRDTLENTFRKHNAVDVKHYSLL